MSGDLPDVSANWVEINKGQLVMGSDIGAFLSKDRNGSAWTPMTGLPNVPVTTIRTDPANADRIVVATFGRGVYEYRFPPGRTTPPEPPTPPTLQPTTRPRGNGGQPPLPSTGGLGIPLLALAGATGAALLVRRRRRAGVS